MTAIVLAYHAIEAGPPPLSIEPDVFRDHLATIEDAGVRVVPLGEIADGPDEPCVAITFDDGFASVVENAAPALVERGLPATVFCVAGHLGGVNDWPGEPPPQRRLASAAELAACGIEIGSHGMTHLRLDRASGRSSNARSSTRGAPSRTRSGSRSSGSPIPAARWRAGI